LHCLHSLLRELEPLHLPCASLVPPAKVVAFLPWPGTTRVLLTVANLLHTVAKLLRTLNVEEAAIDSSACFCSKLISLATFNSQREIVTKPCLPHTTKRSGHTISSCHSSKNCTPSPFCFQCTAATKSSISRQAQPPNLQASNVASHGVRHTIHTQACDRHLHAIPDRYRSTEMHTNKTNEGPGARAWENWDGLFASSTERVGLR